jgi:hypothetical protein
MRCSGEASAGIPEPQSQVEAYSVPVFASSSWLSTPEAQAVQQVLAQTHQTIELHARESESWHLVLDATCCVLFTAVHQLLDDFRSMQQALETIAAQHLQYCWLIVRVEQQMLVAPQIWEVLSVLEQSCGTNLVIRFAASITATAKLVHAALLGAALLAQETWPVCRTHIVVRDWIWTLTRVLQTFDQWAHRPWLLAEETVV